MTNDKLQPQLPVKSYLLEQILFEIGRILDSQYYFKIMYQALFAIAYYGLLRIGEVAEGDHTIQARNVFITDNKKKILLVLYSSKTHDIDSRPQKIKISALGKNDTYKHFCPFELMSEYFRIRGDYCSLHEQFFIFKGHIPVTQQSVRKIFSQAILAIGLDPRTYRFHGIRGGHATDLYNWGFTVEEIKDIGRWKSNAIYKYIKN